jgi:hypothetical protein
MSSANNNQERQAFWKEHVQSYQDSGQSKACYCRDNNLTYHQFIYWSALFSDQPTEVKATPKLVPVMLSEPTATSGLQVQLPNGVLISGINGHCVDIIGRLIDQL